MQKYWYRSQRRNGKDKHGYEKKSIEPTEGEQVRISLIAVDGRGGFPNLALMRLSTWHKQQGDIVDWWNGFERYDRVYMSKVFTFTPEDWAVECDVLAEEPERQWRMESALSKLSDMQMGGM